jgi:hypothetical protein
MKMRFYEMTPLGKVAKNNLVTVNDGIKLAKFLQYAA